MFASDKPRVYIWHPLTHVVCIAVYTQNYIRRFGISESRVFLQYSPSNFAFFLSSYSCNPFFLFPPFFFSVYTASPTTLLSYFNFIEYIFVHIYTWIYVSSLVYSFYICTRNYWCRVGCVLFELSSVTADTDNFLISFVFSANHLSRPFQFHLHNLVFKTRFRCLY